MTRVNLPLLEQPHTACGVSDMAKRFPIHPAHPERTCWGCDRYCAADALICGNGSERTQHPVELWGADWAEWGAEPAESSEGNGGATPPAP